MGEKYSLLPFKVGQMAEARSFIPGYRGAWFRCKIKEIGWRKGHMGHNLEYVDFPDEKVKWVQIYQKSPLHRTKLNETKKELMVRPPFPPVYPESQIACLNTISEETVIVDNTWKVGDLVDWFTDGCYWSGTVTCLLSNEMVKIQLPDHPFGEGGSPYDVCCKDLRPSLAWSPKDGWTVPIPQDGKTYRHCARLIKPLRQGQDVQISSHISANSLPPPETSPLFLGNDRSKQSLDAPESKKPENEAKMNMDTENRGTGKTRSSDSVASSIFRDPSDRRARPTTAPASDKDGFSNVGHIPLNCEYSDTLEAPVLDLEELLNKVKWMKRILKYGVSSNASRPSWKFMEHRAPPK